MLTIVNGRVQPSLTPPSLTLVYMATLTSRLKEAMGTKVSQADLARACQISRAAVTKWMSGGVDDLKMAHLFAVARLCGVEPEWLALGTGQKERGSAPTPPDMDHRHLALLQAYLRLPEEQRFVVRMLIETLDGAQNPRLHQFMRQLEEHNHVRDRPAKQRAT